MKHLLALAAALLLGGCASSHILVGQARPPISPEQVRLYLQPPPVYEEVAILEASNAASWAVTDQQKTDKVVARMKAEAARLGANGIVVRGVGNQYAGSVGFANAWAGGGSAWALGSSSALYDKVGSGLAIHVPEHAEATAAVAAPAGALAPATPPPAVATAPAAAVAPRAATAPAPQAARYEPDPAKRCDACARIRVPE